MKRRLLRYYLVMRLLGFESVYMLLFVLHVCSESITFMIFQIPQSNIVRGKLTTYIETIKN